LAALGGAYPDYVGPGSQRRAHDLMRSGPIAEGDDGRAVDRHALPGNIRGEQVKVNVSTTGAFFQLPIQGDKDDLAIRHRDFVEVLNEHDIAGGIQRYSQLGGVLIGYGPRNDRRETYRLSEFHPVVSPGLGYRNRRLVLQTVDYEIYPRGRDARCHDYRNEGRKRIRACGPVVKLVG